jgi:hypothetical protein
VCNVTPPVVRRWLSLGLIARPPWTVQELTKFGSLPIPMVEGEGHRRHTAR